MSSLRSGPFGVSSTIGRSRKRGSLTSRENALRPSRPAPMCACRSTRLPSSLRESLRWKALRRPSPTIRSRSRKVFEVDQLDDRGELLEGVTDRVTLSRSRLEKYDEIGTFRLVEGDIEALRDGAYAFFGARSPVAPRMEDEVGDTQDIAALHLFDEALARTGEQRAVGGSEVRKVARVRENKALIEPQPQFVERFDLLPGEGAGAPLVAALHEKLDGIALDREPPLEREVHAAGDRHVRAEIHRASRLALAVSTVHSERIRPPETPGFPPLCAPRGSSIIITLFSNKRG